MAKGLASFLVVRRGLQPRGVQGKLVFVGVQRIRLPTCTLLVS